MTTYLKKLGNNIVKDPIYQKILLKIQNQKKLTGEEKSYYKIYNYCYERWKD